jgi:acyl carrier protein
VGESLADAGAHASHTHAAADEEESPTAGAAEKDDEPENDLQAVVAEVWTMFLGRERIGIHDGFYELGGNSLVATRIVLTIREILQVDLPLRSILEYPTVAGFAAEIESAARLLDTDVHQIARVVREISALKPEQVSNRLAGVEAEQSLS